jgi:hypothetical protein
VALQHRVIHVVPKGTFYGVQTTTRSIWSSSMGPLPAQTMKAGALQSHFTHYNFARIHKTLRLTPAMEAGISDHVWSLEEVVSLANRMQEWAQMTLRRFS